MKCPWCASKVLDAIEVSCPFCKGPLGDRVIKGVTFDFSGVAQNIELSLIKLPRTFNLVMPSRLFDLSFDDECAVFAYRGERLPTNPGATYNNIGSGSIANNKSVSAGAYGLAIGGDVQGDIVMGNGNNITKKKVSAPEALVVTVGLPVGVEDIFISGNGKLIYEITYEGATVSVARAEKMSK